MKYILVLALALLTLGVTNLLEEPLEDNIVVYAETETETETVEGENQEETFKTEAIGKANKKESSEETVITSVNYNSKAIIGAVVGFVVLISAIAGYIFSRGKEDNTF